MGNKFVKTSQLSIVKTYIDQQDATKVSSVAYDSTNHKFTKTINGTTTDVIVVDNTAGGTSGSSAPVTSDAVNQGLASINAAKQDTLVSGTNIKTINNTSILGSGNISISGGSGVWGQITGTLSDQTDLNTALTGKADTATTLAGYGITDAKIASGVITLGSNTITPLISHQDISGKENTSNKSTSFSSTFTTDDNYPSSKSVQDFVNSSISTNTATFRGTSASGLTEAEFLAWANGLTKDKNDYVFWNTTDSDGNVVYKRYKYDGSSWAYEYSLNNSSFTASQWATVNSGLVASDKTKLEGISTGANKVEASNTNGNIKVDSSEITVYTHPDSLSAHQEGFYKVANDKEGHVTSATAVDKSDITNVVGAVTTTTDDLGMMSAADKTKLDALVYATDAEVSEVLTTAHVTMTSSSGNVTVPTASVAVGESVYLTAQE